MNPARSHSSSARGPVQSQNRLSGTSAMVGPRFFAGSVAEASRVGKRSEWARRWYAFGWASSAVLVLVAFATLESQSWLSRASGSQYQKVAIIKPAVNLMRDAFSQKPVPAIASASTPRRPTTLSTSPIAVQAPVSLPHPPEFARTDHSSPIQKPKPEHAEVARAQAGELSAQEVLPGQRAAKDNSNARVTLANLYLEGKGAQRNCQEAIALLEAAAARSNVRAQNHLAGLYATGSCVQRDRVQAYRWLKSALATDPENQWARQNLDLTWRQMTTEERTVFESNAR